MFLIKSIQLRNCFPFDKAELVHCKKINFVFGSNGSGKSTIGSFLSGASGVRFGESTIVWDSSSSHEVVYVYNRAFRRDNFHQVIPGIFTVGSEAIGDIKKIDDLKDELEARKDEKERFLKTINDRENERRTCEHKFRDSAWNMIYKQSPDELIKAFDGFRGSKEKFAEELMRRVNSTLG